MNLELVYGNSRWEVINLRTMQVWAYGSYADMKIELARLSSLRPVPLSLED